MSKNINIQEGGVARALTADKLKTNLTEGGTCLWVPEDETQLTRKTITKNGTYSAVRDGFYGYSEVVVRVSGATGGGGIDGANVVVGKDAKGNDQMVSIDESGNIVTVAIPTSISVTRFPNTTTYGDRAYIDYTGIEVTGYDANGASLGPVPFDELMFPVTVAEYDPDTAGVANSAQSSLDLGPFPKPFIFTTGASFGNGRPDEYEMSRVCYLATCATSFDEDESIRSFAIVAASPVPFTLRRRAGDYVYDAPGVTKNGKTAYYEAYYGGTFQHLYPKAENMVTEWSSRTVQVPLFQNVAWTMCYGDVTLNGGASVPVRWQRPGDGALLETTFNIIVIPAGGRGED